MKARLGVFADGVVGARVLHILAARCPELVNYIVVPSVASAAAMAREQFASHVPLIIYDGNADASHLPWHCDEVPDIVLLVWWPKIVKADFLAAGQQATLNLHPSLLPHGQGKDPNFWALADGEPFGVTIHHVTEQIDGGDIAFQAEIPVSWIDNGATLYARAQQRMVELFETSLDRILAMDIPRIHNDTERGSYHQRKQLAERSLIDLNTSLTLRDLLNLLRARTFPPHPGCRFIDDGTTYQIRIEIERVQDQNERIS